MKWWFQFKMATVTHKVMHDDWMPLLVTPYVIAVVAMEQL